MDERGLSCKDERIDSDNIFWAAGTTARPAAQWIGARSAKNGAIEINADCSVPGLNGVYAIGDCTSQTGSDGKPLPGLGAVAKQQGEYLGRLLAAKASGRALPKAFHYKDMGTMAIVGRYRAVARFPFGSVTGPIAWLLWSLVHLLLLMDFRSRGAVYFSWCWSWLTYGRGARLITSTPDRQAPAEHRD
jgi:NADH dehydrogenase